MISTFFSIQFHYQQCRSNQYCKALIMLIASHLPRTVRQPYRSNLPVAFLRNLSRHASPPRAFRYIASIQKQRIRPRCAENTMSEFDKCAQVRRSFSTSSRILHGHIDPPKPGEEYASFLVAKLIRVDDYG